MSFGGMTPVTRRRDRRHKRKLSTTPDVTGEAQRFRVTHPFHPLFGREYEVLYFRQDWGYDRVAYLTESGAEATIPVSLPDLKARDPFVAIAAGRSRLRVEELIELANLIQSIKPKGGGTL
jgi:hypothetical protein